MGMIPEAPETVREAARFAFWEAQMPRDDARSIAKARERIRNIVSPVGIAGLKSEHGGGLWEGRETFEPDFARLSFSEKKRKFMSNDAEDAVSWQGVSARAGAPGDLAFHAAGALLLAWWAGQGNKITANRGYSSTKPGNIEPKPSETAQFLANEFLLIAQWYGNSEWAAPGEEYENFEAATFLHLTRDKALNVGTKVARDYLKRRTEFR